MPLAISGQRGCVVFLFLQLIFQFVPGTVRTGYAYAEMPRKRRHYYADPEVIPGLMLATYDLYSASLHVLAQEYLCGKLTVDTVRFLYNVAVLLFVHFVSVHPFLDGSGMTKTEMV
jgi:hypothetical protein